MEESSIKINDKLISIPPYISTKWQNINSICVKKGDLMISLTDGETVEVPELSTEIQKEIFRTHAQVLEGQPAIKQENNPFPFKMFNPFGESATPTADLMKFSLASPEMGNIMQHSMEHQNAPDLPKELVDKISQILKVILPNDPDITPKAEPHCNCPHCQIARSFFPQKDGEQEPEEKEEEIIKEDELTFNQFLIEPLGNNRFQVTDKLSPNESYAVYLGTPVGCTCGNEGCEHVIAVLKS
ncbi:hypothetical protein N9Y92_01790 [Chlamydiales bacterium]|nr:hypothetical protein [Chlamydiales bacterium]